MNYCEFTIAGDGTRVFVNLDYVYGEETKKLSNGELIEQLIYCGHGPYYRKLYKTTVNEIRDRLNLYTTTVNEIREMLKHCN